MLDSFEYQLSVSRLSAKYQTNSWRILKISTNVIVHNVGDRTNYQLFGGNRFLAHCFEEMKRVTLSIYLECLNVWIEQHHHHDKNKSIIVE